MENTSIDNISPSLCLNTKYLIFHQELFTLLQTIRDIEAIMLENCA